MALESVKNPEEEELIRKWQADYFEEKQKERAKNKNENSSENDTSQNHSEKSFEQFIDEQNREKEQLDSQPTAKKLKIDDSEINISEKYHPPISFKFPFKKFGSGKNEKNRSCNPDWLSKWDWLHYSVAKDSFFCYPCNQAYVQKKLLTKKVETLFIFGDGFSNWKKAIGKEGRIPKHENSEGHRESMKKFCDNGLENNIGAKLSNE